MFKGVFFDKIPHWILPISSRCHGVRGENPLMNQYSVERQQAKSINVWTVFTAGEECKQGSQETCNGTWATSGVHKGSWKGSKRGGDTFADAPMWITLQELKLTTLCCRRISQYWRLVKRMAQQTQCWYRQKQQSVYTYSLNLHKSPHRLMSKTQLFPITVGVL